MTNLEKEQFLRKEIENRIHWKHYHQKNIIEHLLSTALSSTTLIVSFILFLGINTANKFDENIFLVVLSFLTFFLSLILPITLLDNSYIKEKKTIIKKIGGYIMVVIRHYAASFIYLFMLFNIKEWVFLKNKKKEYKDILKDLKNTELLALRRERLSKKISIREYTDNFYNNLINNELAKRKNIRQEKNKDLLEELLIQKVEEERFNNKNVIVNEPVRNETIDN